MEFHIVMYLIGVTIGFAAGSDGPLPAEITKNFSAQIYPLTNIVSVIPGIVLPNIVSLILSFFPNDLETGWNVVFYSFAAFVAFCTILFVKFVDAERQSFDYPESPDLPGTSQGSDEVWLLKMIIKMQFLIFIQPQ